MESNSFNTQTHIAGHENTGRSSESAWRDAREPGQASPTRDGDEASMRRAGEDADNFGRGAADATQDILRDSKSKVTAAAQTGKAYALDAVNAASKKIDSMKGQAADLKQRGMQLAADEPMKALACVAAGSAVLTAVLLTWMRGRR